MSKLFGLDWKDYDAERVALLLTVHNEKNLAEQREIKKAESKAKQRKH